MNDCPEPIDELLDLAEDNIYSMAKIEWWLLKYGKRYQRTSTNIGFDQKKGKLNYYPHHEKYTNELCFLENYFYLDRVGKLYRFEKRLKEILEEYDTVNNDYEKSEAWVIKYHPLWNRAYHDFLFQNMDENIYDTDVRILIRDLDYETYEKYILRDDFKYTLQFVVLYNDVHGDSDFAREQYEQELRKNNSFRHL